jgi:nitroreductase
MVERRATAHFRPDPVPEDYLDAILSLAAQAPSGYNLQPWRFVVVREEERRRALQRAAMGQRKVGEAPVIVVAFGRFEGWRTHMDAIFKEGARRGAGDPEEIEEQKKTVVDFLGNFPPAVWLNRHVMIAVTAMMFAAETYGIDTAPMEGFDPAAVRRVCQLPEDAEIVALLAMGFGRDPDKPYGGRLALEEFVHDETFGKPWMPLD